MLERNTGSGMGHGKTLTKQKLYSVELKVKNIYLERPQRARPLCVK